MTNQVKLIYIQPCSNEIQNKSSFGFDKENKEGRLLPLIDNKGFSYKGSYNLLTNVKSVNCKNEDIKKISQYNVNNCTYNGNIYYYPHNFIKNNKEIKCNNINQNEFWFDFLNNIKKQSELNKKNQIVFVSHHHRLVKLILKLKYKKDHSGKKYGLANCSCIKLYYDSKWTISMTFNGFPDKTNYHYISNIDNIDEIIDTGIIYNNLINLNIDKNTEIYLIRHGNAIHNKPLTKGFTFNRHLDSSLTFLGMYQAIILGNYLKKFIVNDNSVLLFSSYLNRSQHTGLVIINTINNLMLSSNLVNLLKLFDSISYSRLSKILLKKYPKKKINESSKLIFLPIIKKYNYEGFNNFSKFIDILVNTNKSPPSGLFIQKYKINY